MKLTSKSSRVADRFGLIESLEDRIAPAAAAVVNLPANPKFITATSGGAQLVTAGEVLTTGTNGGGAYLLYVAQGQVLVHTTDLNRNNQLDFNEITGLSVGRGGVVVSFVDIHGDVVTDLNPNGTLTDNGKGDVVLDANIVEIDLRSLTTADFPNAMNPAGEVSNHLAYSDYSIFGNIYAGGGLGLNNNLTSGLAIDSSGQGLQVAKFPGSSGAVKYTFVEPVVGGIYVGSAVTGHQYSFGINGSTSDIFGTLLSFNPATGEAGASIYNVGAQSGQDFNIGTLHAGDGGFNAPGGNIVNVSLSGARSGTYQLIAGNAGNGTVGQSGGSIVNFSEAGAVLGKVLLQSGNGGTGLTGAGGNGGQITFNPAAPIAVNADFLLNYGSGGDGYTGGGAGAGTPSGTFVTPPGTGSTGTTQAIDLVSTMHTVGSIGNNTSFDFNGDGLSDAVFSTVNPNQVIVALGEGGYGNFGFTSGGQQNAQYYYLNAPQQVNSIVVGDFTGNGHPDIALASGVAGNGGVEVYLSEYSPTGVFEGFSDPLYTPIPSLQSEGFNFSSYPITKIVAGNFTGHGNLDLAVVTQATNTFSQATDAILMFLTARTDATGHGTGYFYADFSNNNIPFVIYDTPGATDFLLAATALKTGATNDVLIQSGIGQKTFSVLNDLVGSPVIQDSSAFGYVDTNRKVSTKTQDNVTSTQFLPLFLTVTQDTANTNIADVVALSQSPAGYLQIFQGNKTTGGAFVAGGGNAKNQDQAGIDIGGNPVPNYVAMVSVPNAAMTEYSDVAFLEYNKSIVVQVYKLQESNTALPASAKMPTANPVNGAAMGATATASPGDVWIVSGKPAGGYSTYVAFDTYSPDPAVNADGTGPGKYEFGFITGNPLAAGSSYPGFFVSQPLFKGITNSFVDGPFAQLGYDFTAGNGGSSQSGPGGAGGSFGQALTISGSGSSATGIGAITIEFATTAGSGGLVYFNGGNGGNGFNAGGAGGNISGISTTYPTAVQTSQVLLFTGNGGESLTGAGGPGGSESQLSIQSGVSFVAGNGGIGVVGGNGGSLTGTTQLPQTNATGNVNPDVVLQGGNGATGLLGGGTGGPIVSFVNEFDALAAGVGGSLQYIGGSAGNAVGGQAGTGGSILNCSPNSDNNNLVGPIYIQSGTGGNGLYGGAGGSIINFAQIETIKDEPTNFTILAGSGGNATLGTGGAGGFINNVAVSASGTGYTPSGVSVNYNRMVAGQGGSSNGGAGGAGGYITSVNSTSTAAIAQNVLAAGAGGTGLTAGGTGGSITSTVADAGSAEGFGKVVVIAGDGGQSLGAAPAPAKTPEQMAMNIAGAIGGVNGPGGNGGSIFGFTQPTSTATDVDLIAGNGGATVNHSVVAGNVTNGVDNSGIGGSIENISVTGSIGNSSLTVAIKSYNDIFSGQTMQDFVNSDIVNNLSGTMSDTVGNVGLVAGAAGGVEAGRVVNGVSEGIPGELAPSFNGKGGTVTNVHAENIMSMIAGNVDQVNLIQSLTNYGVTVANGILGANKTEFYNPETHLDENSVSGSGVLLQGHLNYLNPEGALVTTPLPGGGELIDGAFLAKNIRKIVSPRDFQGTQSA